VVTAVKESANLVMVMRNQLQEEKSGRERLETRYNELQGEIEQLRQTSTNNTGAISQVKGTMDTMIQQMVKAQDESRQQFQMLYKALMQKTPGMGSHSSNNV
jgi:chromosome segregation ATPase